MAPTSSMTTVTSRKRRAAAIPADADAASNGYDAYNVQGDSKAALSIFQKQQLESSDDQPQASANPNLAGQYNEILLMHLSDNRLSNRDGLDELVKKMQGLEMQFMQKSQDSDLSPRKLHRNDLIFSYNRALILYAQGRFEAAGDMCKEKLSEFITSSARPHDELVTVASRMALLLLECILVLGFDTAYDSERIFNWLEKMESEKDPQLKFLLNLYRSRFNFTELDSAEKHSDTKIRAARKELKQAMDLLQNKLRSSFGAETGSVVSSANSEENSTQSPPPRDPSHHDPQAPLGSIVLQRHSQSALSLKAHSEQLKGNTKKSLVLCSEALGAVAADASYESTHANNLALIYETSGKRHLALHALAKGFDAARRHQTDVDSGGSCFYPDGTARPDQTLVLLHNAAICALQARCYMSAYESMATCLAQSTVFSYRPRSWLRLAEACVGLYVSQCENNEDRDVKYDYTVILANNEPRGVLLDDRLFMVHPDPVEENPVVSLASPDDLVQVKRNPLIRARMALERALGFGDALGEDGISSARIMRAYVALAFHDYDKALVLSQQILDAELSPGIDEAVYSARRRRSATARLYAAEASFAMGKTEVAMEFLAGIGRDDAFDRLASDLGGLSLESAVADGKQKERLERAQTTVRASASSIMAAMGNLAAAKQLAVSAQAMDDTRASSGEHSSALRALLYVLLKDGQLGPALTLLRSIR